MKTHCLELRSATIRPGSKAIVAMLMAASAPAWSADLAKQASFTLTYTVSGNSPAAVDIGGGKWAYIFDSRLIMTNDAGSGFGNNVSARCIGTGMEGSLTGWCLFTDRDGDKYAQTISRAAGTPNGTAKIFNGTGKYRGIEGSLEFFEAPPLAETAPGQSNLIGKVKGSYQLRSD
jgi:hypothetical protein